METYGDLVRNQVKQLLRMFDALPASLIVKFYKQSGIADVTKGLLIDMSRASDIYLNREEDMCYLYHGQKSDINKICCFATMVHLLGKGESHISKARYPFDYIFEHEETLYQLINFSEDGQYKLRFRRNMDETTLKETTPVILTINQSLSALTSLDADMKDTILPQQDYLLVRLRYVPTEKDNPFAINVFEHKRGDIIA